MMFWLNYLLGYRNRDIGHIIENIVYFELLYRGYDVAIGKIGNYEIDFIATKDNEKKYIQVSKSLLDDIYNEDVKGIKIKNLINWLVEK